MEKPSSTHQDDGLSSGELLFEDHITSHIGGQTDSCPPKHRALSRRLLAPRLCSGPS